MLRISESNLDGMERTVHVEGQVVGEWVRVVRLACERALTDGHRLTVDLRDVSYADRDGVALLKELCEKGILLANCSPFVGEQLREVGLDCKPVSN
jgi:hypothetical protein